VAETEAKLPRPTYSGADSVVRNTLSLAECAALIHALHTLKDELLSAPEEEPPRGPGARGPGRGGAFIRPGRQDAPLHFLAHLIESDAAITAYAAHPRIVAACEEYIGGEARIVESNGFINTGNSKGFARDALAPGETFVPSWHRGADLPYASHSVNGLSHCNFVKALTNLTPLSDASDGGTALIPGSHKMDIGNSELAAMATANPSMVYQVVAPPGSTLIFGETTMHATGLHTSSRERCVRSTNCVLILCDSKQIEQSVFVSCVVRFVCLHKHIGSCCQLATVLRTCRIGLMTAAIVQCRKASSHRYHRITRRFSRGD
jgi:ectoine hydroxylase-related dioxygenase (phytanoyl-CoA dioxygenase family)